MNSTEAKILTVLAEEMTKTTDVVKAAWNACHRINAEAVALWGPEFDGKAFNAAAVVIKDSFAKALVA